MLAITAVAVAIASSNDRDEGADYVYSSPSSRKDCASFRTKEPCREILVGGLLRRYTLIPAVVATKSTVIIDIGGPGQSVLMGNHISGLRSSSSVLSSYNILALEEPWVTADIPEACDSAMSSYYRSLRAEFGTASGAAERLALKCEIGSGHWGFDPGDYRQIVESILAEEGLSLVGFVGHSWGTVRLSYLELIKPAWAILVRPFPLGVPAQRLVETRVRELDAMGAPAVPPDNSRVPDRSISVLPFDSLTAWVSLGYVDDIVYSDYVDRLRGGSDLSLVSELSDDYWGRYGQDSLSPAFLARAEESCWAVGKWAEPFRSASDVGDVIAATFLPCASPARFGPLPSEIQKCIVSGSLDIVTPDHLVREAFSRSGVVHWVTSAVRSHRSFDGLSECIEAVATVAGS